MFEFVMLIFQCLKSKILVSENSIKILHYFSNFITSIICIAITTNFLLGCITIVLIATFSMFPLPHVIIKKYSGKLTFCHRDLKYANRDIYKCVLSVLYPFSRRSHFFLSLPTHRPTTNIAVWDEMNIDKLHKQAERGKRWFFIASALISMHTLQNI
jgi:hypothetical protein